MNLCVLSFRAPGTAQAHVVMRLMRRGHLTNLSNLSAGMMISMMRRRASQERTRLPAQHN
jgi:hypothetical protein